MINGRNRRWFRFLAGGGLNTIVTYALYLGINQILSYQISYLIAYVTGIVFSYCLNAIFVFRVQLSWKGLFTFPLVYIFQYVASAILLGAMVEFGSINAKIAPLFVPVIMIPVTYSLVKFTLIGKKG
jgi:putative flippase GtrA